MAHFTGIRRIFLGGLYIEHLQGSKSLSMALSSITAAVVGVVFNLAVWFAVNTLFGKVNEVALHGMRLLVPVWSTINWASAIIAAGAFMALLRFKLGMVITLAGSVAAGVIYHHDSDMKRLYKFYMTRFLARSTFC